MKKIKLLLAAIAAMVSLGVQAGSDWVAPSAPSATDPVSGGVYKIRNVGAGQYLTGGAAWFSWATSAVLGNVNSAHEWTLTGSDAAGYTFACNRSGNNKLFTSGNSNAEQCMHVDGANTTTYFLEKQASGYYRLRQDGVTGKYVGGPDGSGGILAQIEDTEKYGANSCDWEFVPLSALTTYGPTVAYAEMRAIVLSYIDMTDIYTDANDAVATLQAGVYAQDDVVDAATTAEEVNNAIAAIKALILPFVSSVTIKDGKSFDITSFITNPSFESGFTGWTNSGMATQANNSFAGKVGSTYAEAWQPNGTKSVSQTLNGLPAGYYTLSANILARTVTSAKLYAGTAEVPATIVDASNPYSLVFNCADNANVTIGFEAVGTGAGASWIAIDNFGLTYLGKAPLVLFQNELAEAVNVARAHATALSSTIPAAALTAYNNAIDAAAADNATIDACQASVAAIEAATATADALVAPYAAYNSAKANATFAGVADATIDAQDSAVAAATDAATVNSATEVLKAATDALAIDITSFTIKNPTAQSKTDWEGTDFGGQSDGVTEYWNSKGADFHQTINLPAGKYRMTVVALQRTDRQGIVYAGENSTVIAQVSSSIVNNRGQAASWFAAGNGRNYVNFTLDAAADVTIGLTADATTSDYWTVWQGFKLETFTEAAAASYLKPGYDDAMAAAVAYQTVDMFDEDKTALNNAITDNTVEEASATIAAYEAAIVNLNAAAAAAATAAANYTQYNAVVAAIGENTNVNLTSFVTNADFQLNNLNGWTSVDGGNVANNGNFNNTYFVERWKNGVALGNGSLTHDAIVLPAGLYRITADAQNIEQYNNNVGGTGLFLCANEEKTEIGAKGNYSVYIKVADKTPLTIKFVQDDCTGNWVAYDNVTLTYVAADYVYELVDGKMNATVAAAQTDAETAFTGNQNGETYQALMTAIAAAQASKDAYTAAAAALTKANSILNSTNVYTAEARTAFSEAIATAQAAYDDASMDDATANGLNAALNTANWGDAQTLGAAYIGSTWSGTNINFNFWSWEGDGEGASGMSTPFIQAWVADAEKLADNNITATLSGLENGLYSVTAFMRAFNNKEGDDAGYDGISFAVNEGTPVAFADATQYTDGYAKEITAEGLVKDGNLVIKVAIEGTNASWLSFKNVNYTKVRDLNPEEMAVVPTAIALFNGEDEVTEPIALNKTNNSVTLTPSYTPAEATEGYINWTSSDESVATVSSLGEVTAVLPGTATITATSTLDNTVSGSATITVSYPESDYAASTFINDGATRYVTTLGENLIKNGSFEYPNALYGWTAKNTYTEAANASNFTITANGGVNDGAFVTTNAGGGGAATSLSRAIPVEAGKKYYFAVYTSGKAPTSANLQYNALFKLKNDKSEDGKLKEFEWPQGANNTTSEWSKTEYVFTADADHPYVGVRMSWNANSSFDNFVLAEITSEETIGNVQYALDAIPTTNIGTGAFQYSQDAIDDANALVQGEATVADVEAAYAAVTTVNEPAEGQLFNVILTYGGWTYDQKAMTYIANGRNDGGLYNIQYKEAANQNLAQAFTFTKVSGNNYKMSQIDADGNVRYISTGVPYGGNTGQIRTTTDAEAALVVTVIPTATEGKWNLRNTEANNYIGSQDAGVFTVNSHIDFNIVETQKPSITINTTAAGYGTVMLPFAVAEENMPEGVTVYTCKSVDGSTLILDKVNALEANKPYIIEGAWDAVLTGDAQGTALTYTEGLLTGVYAPTSAPVESYVLQNLDEGVGFYQVADGEGQQPTVRANRAYLTEPSAGVKALFFPDTTTAIRSIFDMDANQEGIYDLQGRKVTRMQRGGIYVIGGRKVVVK